MKHFLPFYWQVFDLSPLAVGWENDSLLYSESHFILQLRFLLVGLSCRVLLYNKLSRLTHLREAGVQLIWLGLAREAWLGQLCSISQCPPGTRVLARACVIHREGRDGIGRVETDKAF